MAYADLPNTVPNMRRVYTLAVLITLGLAALITRLWYLQVAHGDDLLEASEVNRTRLIRSVPARGRIEDRNGQLLATNRTRLAVTVVPAELNVNKNPEAIKLLASLMNLDPIDLVGFLRDAARINSYEPFVLSNDLDLAMATRLEEHRMNLPGVNVGPLPVRQYPDGNLFGHLLGYIGQISPEELKERKTEGYRPGDFSGKLGIERAYDPELRGSDGGMKVEVDAKGRLRKELEQTASIPGSTLTLTVDRGLQKVTYDELAKWGQRGYPGAAVALDPQTGAVLSMVSFPSYDPNEFVTGITNDKFSALRDNPLKPLINRAIGSAYAPGSTFKMITGAAGLDEGLIDKHSSVNCTGVIYLGKYPKRCHKHGGHGTVDLNAAIAGSCDVYFYRLGQRLGPDKIAAYARRFGLGERTGIDLLRERDPAQERKGIVPTPEWKRKNRKEPWVGGDTVDYAIGQSMLGATPLQMANIAAAIGNGGTLYKPQLLAQVTTYNELGTTSVSRRLKPVTLGKLGISDGAMSEIVRGMHSVMTYGTGSKCAIPGLEMAGKTGTAQMMKGGRMTDNAWFIGYAPLDRPRIAVAVFVEGGGHGGDTAAPIARKMIANYLKIPVAEVTVGPATD